MVSQESYYHQDWQIMPPSEWNRNTWAAYKNGIVQPTRVVRGDSQDELMKAIAHEDSLPFEGACCPKAKTTPCVCRLSFQCPDHYPHGVHHGSHD
ncbi:MAG: hypothetical protein NXI32_04900 [bacterium]|nr:hypothetical protein [bacterium]